MVAIESEVARIKVKITNLTVKSLHNQDEEILNDERITEAQQLFEYLKTECEMIEVPEVKVKRVDSAERVKLNQRLNKLRFSVENTQRTIQACGSV